jgi:hypothetical protein
MSGLVSSRIILLADAFPPSGGYIRRKQEGAMRKIIMTYGVVAGIIIVGFMGLIMVLCAKGIIPFENTEIIGYASMLVALSMIFFGIKSYRDRHLRGAIGFWKGVQVGLLITLIATLLYFAGGELYHQTSPGLQDEIMEKYGELQVKKLKDRGAPQAEIDGMVKEIAGFKELSESVLFRLALAFIEFFPVGLVVTPISAAILRRREVLPA